MSTVEIIGLILGNLAVVEVVRHILNKRSAKAAVNKVDTETGSLALESEIRTSEFYKKEWQELIKRYDDLEKKLEDKIKEHLTCKAEISVLQKQYEELLRQIVFLKTQINGGVK